MALRIVTLLLALVPPLAAATTAAIVGPHDRVLVLAPHPDDESLGAGGVIAHAHAVGAPVRIVFLTNGDANELSFAVYARHPVVEPEAVLRMGQLRHDEALAAGRALGLGTDDLVFLGYPDFGTLDILTTHWGTRPPLRSLLTRVTAVPYATAFRPGAPYKGEDVLRDLKAVIGDFRPTVVFVSHPADEHPDHRALYLFARLALWDLAPAPPVRLYPFLIHHRDWPAPAGLHEQVALAPPAAFADAIAWQAAPLTDALRAAKQAALRAHDSQMRYSANFMRSFVRANELFGDFPAVTLVQDARPVPAAAGAGDPPPGLEPEQAATWVGLEDQSVRLDGDEVVLSTRFSRPLGETAGLTVFLFGYRADRPFAGMPRIRVEFGLIEHRVFDQDTRLDHRTVTVTRAPRAITVRIRRAALGDPGRILTSAHTSLALVPLATLPWRVLELPGG